MRSSIQPGTGATACNRQKQRDHGLCQSLEQTTPTNTTGQVSKAPPWVGQNTNQILKDRNKKEGQRENMCTTSS